MDRALCKQDYEVAQTFLSDQPLRKQRDQKEQGGRAWGFVSWAVVPEHGEVEFEFLSQSMKMKTTRLSVLNLEEVLLLLSLYLKMRLVRMLL